MAIFYSERRLTVAGHAACMTLSVLLTPVCLVLALSLYSIYSLASCVLTRFGWIMPIIGDTFVGIETDTLNGYINGGFFMENEADVEVLRQRIDSVGVSATDANGRKVFPKFTRILHRRAGYLVWREDPNFALENHIWGDRLSSNNNPVRSKQELEEVLNDHYNRMMPRDRPGWEMIVIHLAADWRGIRPYDLDFLPRSIVLLRFQHCMMDGLSITRFCSEIVANDGDKVPAAMKKMMPNWNPPKHGRLHRELRLWALRAATLVWTPYEYLRIQLEQDDTFLQGVRETKHKYFSWGNVLSMEKVKAIKNVTGTTINDVLMSSVAAGVTRFFIANGEKPPPSLQSMMPISVQRLDRPIRMFNEVLGAFVQLCTAPALDPLARLRKTQRYTTAVKSSLAPFLLWHLSTFMCRVLPAWLIRRHATTRSPTVMYSCVPGPNIGVNYAYHRVMQLVAFTPNFCYNYLSFTCISYHNSVTVCVTMDSSICKDIQQARDVVRYVEEEFERLADAVNVN